MTNLKVTNNADLGFKNFALTYLSSKNVKFGVEAASYFLDTVEDVNCFEKMLALFLAGQYTTTVEKMNDDCTWTNKIVKYEA